LLGRPLRGATWSGCSSKPPGRNRAVRTPTRAITVRAGGRAARLAAPSQRHCDRLHGDKREIHVAESGHSPFVSRRSSTIGRCGRAYTHNATRRIASRVTTSRKPEPGTQGVHRHGRARLRLLRLRCRVPGECLVECGARRALLHGVCWCAGSIRRPELPVLFVAGEDARAARTEELQRPALCVATRSGATKNPPFGSAASRDISWRRGVDRQSGPQGLSRLTEEAYLRAQRAWSGAVPVVLLKWGIARPSKSCAKRRAGIMWTSGERDPQDAGRPEARVCGALRGES